jgi:hypothetical protein
VYAPPRNLPHPNLLDGIIIAHEPAGPRRRTHQPPRGGGGGGGHSTASAYVKNYANAANRARLSKLFQTGAQTAQRHAVAQLG